MQVASFKWEINGSESHKESRYCHGCGREVLFEDSLMRRQNANGKNIFHFAIYKCPQMHTWNKKLGQFKAHGDLNNRPVERSPRDAVQEPVSICTLLDKGVQCVEIHVEARCKVRLDKVISEFAADVSRSRITTWFDRGRVLVDGEPVSKDYRKQGRFTIEIRF